MLSWSGRSSVCIPQVSSQRRLDSLSSVTTWRRARRARRFNAPSKFSVSRDLVLPPPRSLQRAGALGRVAGASPGVSARLPPTIPTEVPMRLIGLAVVLALGFTLAPLVVGAEQQAGKVYRIGYLRYYGCAEPEHFTELRQGLRDLGYAEGHNLVIECRAAPGKAERIPNWLLSWFASTSTLSLPRVRYQHSQPSRRRERFQSSWST